jgi:hypothetical protein
MHGLERVAFVFFDLLWLLTGVTLVMWGIGYKQYYLTCPRTLAWMTRALFVATGVVQCMVMILALCGVSADNWVSSVDSWLGLPFCVIVLVNLPRWRSWRRELAKASDGATS